MKKSLSKLLILSAILFAICPLKTHSTGHIQKELASATELISWLKQQKNLSKKLVNLETDLHEFVEDTNQKLFSLNQQLEILEEHLANRRTLENAIEQVKYLIGKLERDTEQKVNIAQWIVFECKRNGGVSKGEWEN